MSRRAPTHDSDDDEDRRPCPSTATTGPGQSTGASTGAFILRRPIVSAWGATPTPTATNTYAEPPTIAKQFLPGQSVSVDAQTVSSTENPPAPPRKKRHRKEKPAKKAGSWRVEGYTNDPAPPPRPIDQPLVMSGPYNSAFRASEAPLESSERRNMTPAPTASSSHYESRASSALYHTASYPAPIGGPSDPRSILHPPPSGSSYSRPVTSTSQIGLLQPVAAPATGSTIPARYDPTRGYVTHDVRHSPKAQPQRASSYTIPASSDSRYTASPRATERFMGSSNPRLPPSSHAPPPPPRREPSPAYFHQPTPSYDSTDTRSAAAPPHAHRPSSAQSRAPASRNTSQSYSMPPPPPSDLPWELQAPELRLLAILIEDHRYKDPQIAEFDIPVKAAGEGMFWADAKDVCEILQRSPGRIDGPAKVYQWRGQYQHFFLRVSADNRDYFVSTNLQVSADRTLSMVVEHDDAPSAPAMMMAPMRLPRAAHTAVSEGLSVSPAGSGGRRQLPTPDPSERSELHKVDLLGSASGAGTAVKRTASVASAPPPLSEVVLTVEDSTSETRPRSREGSRPWSAPPGEQQSGDAESEPARKRQRKEKEAEPDAELVGNDGKTVASS